MLTGFRHSYMQVDIRDGEKGRILPHCIGSSISETPPSDALPIRSPCGADADVPSGVMIVDGAKRTKKRLLA
jgi:hypothetical protein